MGWYQADVENLEFNISLDVKVNVTKIGTWFTGTGKDHFNAHVKELIKNGELEEYLTDVILSKVSMETVEEGMLDLGLIEHIKFEMNGELK